MLVYSLQSYLFVKIFCYIYTNNIAMSKKAKVLKILKWVAIASVACFILPILWFGTQYQNPDEGKIKFFWSGFEALFSDADFGLLH